MKTIPLTRGYFVKVDDKDYEKFAFVRWYAFTSSKHTRAVRVIKRNGKKTMIFLAREIINAPRGKYVDHINGDTLNDQKNNLRLSTRSQNLANRRKTIKNTSGYKGVHFYKTKNLYQSKIKNIHIGYFKTAIEAAKAYDKKAKELFGEFAKFNF